MKLSVAIADSFAPPDAFVVWRGFDDSIKKAKEFGYDGVELALRSAGDVDALRLLKTLERNGVEPSAISTGQVFASLRQYLTNTDETQRTAAVKTLCDLAVLAGDFGGTVNLGRARGFYPDGARRADVEELFMDSLKRIADVAARHDVTVVVEPVNRYEINFINNLDECAALLGAVGYDNVGIMPDVFHMNIEDAHIGGALKKHAKFIRYIHLADSNRHAPGSGHMDFDEIFGALAESGYNGWAAVEILPMPDPDTAARASAEFLLPRVAEYNRVIKERGAI